MTQAELIKKAEQVLIATEKEAKKIEPNIATSFRRARRNLNREIRSLYSNFNDIDIADLNSYIPQNQLKFYKADILDNIETAMENNYSRIYVNQSRALYTQRRVTYGNALDSNIDFHTEALYSEIQQEMTDNFKKIYEQSFYRTTYNTIMQVGLMLPFVKPTPKTVNEALKTEWYRATYTDRARQHKLKLADDLKRSVRQSFSAQNKPPQAIKEVTALTQTAENSLVRLNDSHTSFVNDKAVLDSYESTSNLEKYQFIATLDDVTTDICQSLDNKIFELEEAEVGVNYPPMHNRCRSVTIARFEQKELNELYKESQRAARKGVGQKVSGTGKATGKTYTVNANLTYAEWRKQIEE